MRNNNHYHHFHYGVHNHAQRYVHHQHFQVQTIDIEALYRQLSAALNERAQYEIQQDNMWRLIKQTHSNHRPEMIAISNRIGESTHKLNQIISQLCRYKKTHQAMNMADRYLQKEIDRNQRIVSSWNRTIGLVEQGRSTLIDAAGNEHTNTQSSRIYVQKKREQLRKLQQWQAYVHAHRA